jgi:hypothetical protein
MSSALQCSPAMATADGMFPPPPTNDVLTSQPEKKAVKDMNVYIIQDISTSMECNYKANVCLITFSSHDNIVVGEVIPVHETKKTTFSCEGMTALWDAIGIGMSHMREKSGSISATMYIFTDGDNNDSRKYSGDEIREIINTHKSEFPTHSVLFIGSDPTTKKNANKIGLDDTVHSIQHDSCDTPVVYRVCSHALDRCVSGDTQCTQFNEEDIAIVSEPKVMSYDSGDTGQVHAYDHDQTDSQIDDYESDYVPSRAM